MIYMNYGSEFQKNITHTYYKLPESSILLVPDKNFNYLSFILG